MDKLHQLLGVGEISMPNIGEKVFLDVGTSSRIPELCASLDVAIAHLKNDAIVNLGWQEAGVRFSSHSRFILATLNEEWLEAMVSESLRGSKHYSSALQRRFDGRALRLGHGDGICHCDICEHNAKVVAHLKS
ncbi:MAG: hypothetical protein UU61_C0025G0006 [Parcubacteria group bacterium GW2011_GWB1_41_4]|nr:MAG: hypothetical protein UU61_C0025G0006 [Parcubacteria group bacterium GW2011_GWB1_41_4]